MCSRKGAGRRRGDLGGGWQGADVVDAEARGLAPEHGRGRQRNVRGGCPPGRVAELGEGRGGAAVTLFLM